MTNTTHKGPHAGPKSNVSAVLPARSAADLELLVSALTVLAKAGHERMTVHQALFFLAAAYHDVMNQSVTVSRIREIYDPLGRSVEKSSLQFLEPSKKNEEALGWLTQKIDEDDRRVRFLHLTDDGQDVVTAIIEAMRGV